MGTTMKGNATRRLLTALTAGFAFFGLTERAEAQEILLTGPLAGAPAVRKLRLYREGRFEVAPAVSFTLLDEYQRTILFGGRITYNFTDWLGLGVFGSYGAVKITTGLTDKIQDVNAGRNCENDPTNIDCRLTAVNMGNDFKKQIADLDWVLAPQITLVPFRGKIALFQSIYLDTDLYFFGGPAFVGIKDRPDCGPGECTTEDSFEPKSRVAIAPTFGLGFTFYINKWNALGFEWRGLPFAWNSGGFDTAGADPNGEFPDNQINADDRQFAFNQMLTISYNFYFPTDYRVSE